MNSNLTRLTTLIALIVLPFLAVAGPVALQAATQQEAGRGRTVVPPAANAGEGALQVASPLTDTIRYTVTELGDGRANAINDAGQIAGVTSDGHAFLWLPDPAFGLPAGVNLLGDNTSRAYAINNEGKVVGAQELGEELYDKAILWENGSMNNLGTFGGNRSLALDISNAGQIVGWAEIEEGNARAFLWENGNMTDLGTPGGPHSFAYAVNERGQIMGLAHDGNGEDRSFLWLPEPAYGLPAGMNELGTTARRSGGDINEDGEIVGTTGDTRPYLWLPEPAYGLPVGINVLATSGVASAIDDSGKVVGTTGATAFIWENGTMTNLNDLIDPDSDWVLESAEDINDSGQIVGYGMLNGERSAFLLTPEETPWTVMFYLDGDNDLHATYPPILNQLEAAADNPNVNVIVLWDSIGAGDSTYYHVQHDTNFAELADYVEGETMWSQGELNMGFPGTLSDFATWAMEEFPARHYALILDDHGSGLGGGLLDETSGRTMNLPEMQLALATIHEQSQQKIDVLYMAMCLMGMIEDAYQFRNHVDYYVANEHLQWAFVEPYYPYVAGITETSTPAEVAQHFAGAYADVAEAANDAYTISVVDIAQLGPLAEATQGLGGELDWAMEEISPTLTAVLSDVQRFDNKRPRGINMSDTSIDLYHFADLVSLNLLDYGDIVIAATEVMSAVDDAVIYERHASDGSTNLDNSHGISIFFPSTSSSFYHPDNYDFVVGANWDDIGIRAPTGAGNWGTMLVNYIQQVNPDGPDDAEPPEPVPKLLSQTQTFLPIVIR